MKSSPRLAEAHPEVLARHWTEAGETEPAIAEWSRAGEAAQARNAFREALESYQQALALLNTVARIVRSVTFANWSLGNQSFGCFHYERVCCA